MDHVGPTDIGGMEEVSALGSRAMSADTWSLAAGLVMAAVGAVLGWFVPALIGRIPEPTPEPGPPFREVGSAGEPEV